VRALSTYHVVSPHGSRLKVVPLSRVPRAFAGAKQRPQGTRSGGPFRMTASGRSTLRHSWIIQARRATTLTGSSIRRRSSPSMWRAIRY